MEIHLLFDDCLKALKLIDDESIDLIVTDPPYGISVDNKIVRKNTTDVEMNFGKWDWFDSERDFRIFTKKWMIECYRVMTKEAWIYVFFCNRHDLILLNIAKRLGLLKRTVITWRKTNPVPSYRKFNWVSGTELIHVYSKTHNRIKNFTEQYRMNNWKETSCRSNYGTTGHPNEKPVDVILDLVEASSLENDIVLDPFMGSGTTGVACAELNRNFIGIEANEKWYETAVDRIGNKMFQLKTEKVGNALLV